MLEYGWGFLIFGIAIGAWLVWKAVRVTYHEIVLWMKHIQDIKLVKSIKEEESQGYDCFKDAKAEEEIEANEKIILYGPDGKLIEWG